jgi:hypothetical protein
MIRSRAGLPLRDVCGEGASDVRLFLRAMAELLHRLSR